MIQFQNNVVRPYSKLAKAYDITLGVPYFRHTKQIFNRLIKKYNIKFRSAADIGCGTGLFACYLNHNWDIPVFAVDRSKDMLNVAIRNCNAPKISFLHQDLRRLRLPCPVDLITANFDTMNHLLKASDLKGAFHHIFKNLNPGGHFIFDLLTDHQPLYQASVYIIRFKIGSGKELLQQIKWYPYQRILATTVIIKKPKLISPQIEEHIERVYSPKLVCQWLRDTGFVIRGIHDALNFRIIKNVLPSRVIIIAKRI